MQVIPLDPVPSQTLNIILSLETCIITVYQRSNGLYLDLTISGTPVLNGVLCLDQNFIVLNSYLGFIGDLVFVDTLGTSDPYYTGLGTQYLLLYLLPTEVVAPATVVPYWQPVVTPTPTPVPTLTPVPTPTPTPTVTPTPTPTPTATPTPTPQAPTGPTGVTVT